jgi:hypothetical protein
MSSILCSYGIKDQHTFSLPKMLFIVVTMEEVFVKARGMACGAKKPLYLTITN